MEHWTDLWAQTQAPSLPGVAAEASTGTKNGLVRSRESAKPRPPRRDNERIFRHSFLLRNFPCRKYSRDPRAAGVEVTRHRASLPGVAAEASTDQKWPRPQPRIAKPRPPPWRLVSLSAFLVCVRNFASSARSRSRSFISFRFRALAARHTPTSPDKACVGGAHVHSWTWFICPPGKTHDNRTGPEETHRGGRRL